MRFINKAATTLALAGTLAVTGPLSALANYDAGATDASSRRGEVGVSADAHARIRHPALVGTVTSIVVDAQGGATLTVEATRPPVVRNEDGTTDVKARVVTVMVNADTVILGEDLVKAVLADIEVGEKIMVKGSKVADGLVEADIIFTSWVKMGLGPKHGKFIGPPLGGKAQQQ